MIIIIFAVRVWNMGWWCNDEQRDPRTEVRGLQVQSSSWPLILEECTKD